VRGTGGGESESESGSGRGQWEWSVRHEADFDSALPAHQRITTFQHGGRFLNADCGWEN